MKKLKSDVQILSLCYTSAPEGVYVNVIIGGLANGHIKWVTMTIMIVEIVLLDFGARGIFQSYVN